MLWVQKEFKIKIKTRNKVFGNINNPIILIMSKAIPCLVFFSDNIEHLKQNIMITHTATVHEVNLERLLYLYF